MQDRQLAGSVIPSASWEPIQLWAGETHQQGGTTQGVVAAGQVIGKLNAQGHTYKFGVVALVNGKLVAWDPTAGGQAADNATGTLTIANAVPAVGDKFTVQGKDFVFAAAADPDDVSVVPIGGTIAATATSLAAAINAYRDDFGTPFAITAKAAAGVTTIRAPGVAGNAVTIAKTFATGANGAVSGATLAGGDDDTAEVGGAARPYGILPHAMDTSATGTNADTPSSVFITGDPNFEALDLPAGTTYQEIKAAFARTGINVQQLY